jgi:pimeloyl-ACP methyl ester carboxylesterase
VKGLCDALEIERPIVLGWSFGGFVAMAYAARHPEHPARLILQSTAAHLSADRIAAAFGELGGPAAAEAARAFWTDHDNESVGRYLEHCIPLYHSEPLTEQMTRCVLNLELLTGFEGEMEMDIRAGLGQVHVPTLVLAGRQDPITPVAASEEIVESLGSTEVTLEVFDDAAHFIQLSAPERFFSVVRSFIADWGDDSGQPTFGSSNCSMNSRRIPPGASTKAMRLTPNAPETTLGPQRTVWTDSSASRSSTKRAGCKNPSGGSVHASS